VTRASPERALHIQAVQFLRRALPHDLPVWHCANGEHRDINTGRKLKAFGVLPGVPDLCFLLPTGKAGFIELKAGKGKLTDAQQAFATQAQDLGAYWAECRSLEEVERTLINWLSPFNVKLNARVAA